MSRTSQRVLILEMLDKDEIREHASSSNVVASLVPHQSEPLLDLGTRVSLDLPYENCSDVQCSCKAESKKESAPPFYEFLSRTLKEDPTCTVWLSPSLLPVSCFLACVGAWMELAKNLSGGATIGMAVPSEIEPSAHKHEPAVWIPSMSGKHEERSTLENAVWYPSLSRTGDEIESFAEKLDIFRIFPITEVSNEARIGSYPGMTTHSRFLDENRVRTGKVMYVNRLTPNETFEYLAISIERLPRRPTATSPVLTPGGDPKTYLAMTLAAVATGSFLLMPKQETFKPIPTNEFFLMKSEG